MDKVLGSDESDEGVHEASPHHAAEREVFAGEEESIEAVERPPQVAEVRRAPLVALPSGQDAGGHEAAAVGAQGAERTSSEAASTVRKQTRRAGVNDNRVKGASPVNSSLPSDAARYAELEERLSAVLRPSHLTALRIIFENTVAIGEAEYRVAGPKLAEEIGVERRQLTNVLLKLEKLKVIEKEEWTKEKRSLGLVFRFTGFRSV
ncbi:MAG: hypothetical protein ACJ74Q_15850 [Pyrinomonadaceae bacterium]